MGILKLLEKQWEKLLSNYLLTLPQNAPKTSEPFAHTKKDSDTRELFYTELSPNLCFKEEISLNSTVLEVNQSTDPLSMTKIFKQNIPNQDFFLWLIEDLILMDPNSSSPLLLV